MGKLYNAQELLALLPYNPAMLMVDKVFVESDTKAIGQKNLTMNDAVFQGHFPGHPLLPGVLQIEAIAQTAEVLLRAKLDPEFKNDFYLKQVRRVKFRKPNVPGDRIQIEIEVTAIHEDIAEFTAVIKNGGGVACNALCTVAVRPKVADTVWSDLFNEYDKNTRCAMDITEVQKFIPHRYPFLLVDYISAFEGNHVTGIKNLTANEPILRKYSDGYTVLTSVIQSEMAAQAGAVNMLSREANKGKIAVFMGIDDSQYFAPVYPGQQLRMEIDMPDSKSRFGKGQGCVYADGVLASQTSMLFAIIDA